MENFDYKVLGFTPDDSRLQVNRHTCTVFPITKFSSATDVEKTRETLRFNLRMAAGLYPYPERTPLNARYEDVGIFDGYSVKKIMLETRPGFWSTGNLYLPHPLPKKAPAILNVIGHWEKQRLAREESADYPRQLANFAKMGFICLVTDMIGKIDSKQISHEYGDDKKDLWSSNGVGVQLWNNIRALDFLCSLPEVDAENIGVTGASGGGSQTLFLALLDERIKAAAPINMISLHMQGGCRCENAAGLRRFTDNAVMCAMIAPRALFLAGSDGDWTKNLESAELPAVLEAYRQYNAEDMVEHFYQIAPHQYNEKTRHKVYSFFARHLMGKEIIWNELPIEVEDLSSLTWFKGEEHADGYFGDAEFFEGHRAERVAAISTLSDSQRRDALAWACGIRKKQFEIINISKQKEKSLLIKRFLVFAEDGVKLPAISIIPDGWDKKRVCLALGANGKSCLERAELRAMLNEGIALISGDLFMTGEFKGAEITVHGSQRDNRFYQTFNYSTDAHRAQDAFLLTDVAARLGESVSVWAEGRAAIPAICALAISDSVESATIDESELALNTDEDYLEKMNFPAIRALGGIEGCKALMRCSMN